VIVVIPGHLGFKGSKVIVGIAVRLGLRGKLALKVPLERTGSA
jgi:hypothetical protein